jgi:integrase
VGELFERAKTDPTITADTIKAAVSLDVEAIAQQYKARALSILPPRDDAAYWLNLKPVPKDDPNQLPLLDTLSSEVEAAAKMSDLGIPLNPTTYNMIRAVVVRVHQEAVQERQAVYQEAAQERQAQIAQEMANLDKMARLPNYQEKVQERRAQLAQEMVNLHALAKLTGDKPPAMAPVTEPVPTATATPAVPVETLGAALEAWLADPRAGGGKPQRQRTAEGHRNRARRFIKFMGGDDVLLTEVTQAKASDFLATLGKKETRTRNNYQLTMWCMFKNAIIRGRFDGKNPFDGLRRQLTDEEKESKYVPFEFAEMSILLADAKPEVRPAIYNWHSALQWAAVIGPYAGMRREELAGLNASDVYQEIVDEEGKQKAWVFDVHNGENRALKNRAAIRKIPIHSEIIRVGFLDYVAALPKGGKLFPGLVARQSKGGQLGARLGEEFGDWLIRLGIKREKLVYHSFRHNMEDAMDDAKVYPPHKSRVLGHALSGQRDEKRSGGQAEQTGHYGRGPGLKRLVEAVEAVTYPGIKIPSAKRQKAGQK